MIIAHARGCCVGCLVAWLLCKRSHTLHRYGVSDAWPVMAEPFLQWVVQDNFASGRPVSLYLLCHSLSSSRDALVRLSSRLTSARAVCMHACMRACVCVCAASTCKHLLLIVCSQLVMVRGVWCRLGTHTTGCWLHQTASNRTCCYTTTLSHCAGGVYVRLYTAPVPELPLAFLAF